MHSFCAFLHRIYVLLPFMLLDVLFIIKRSGFPNGFPNLPSLCIGRKQLIIHFKLLRTKKTRARNFTFIHSFITMVMVSARHYLVVLKIMMYFNNCQIIFFRFCVSKS